MSGMLVFEMRQRYEDAQATAVARIAMNMGLIPVIVGIFVDATKIAVRVQQTDEFYSDYGVSSPPSNI